jgi:hypothetical protein
LPQFVPSVAAAPVSTHTGLPVAQESAPRWQTLFGRQLAPSSHAMQRAAASHTRSLPHTDPGGRLPVSRHTDVPPLQDVLPVLHASGSVQSRFSVQAEQRPLEHTRLVPHDAPLASDAPVSVHTGAPVAQESSPVWQGLFGSQPSPSAQPTQLPLGLHTRPLPQPSPAGLLPLSRHTKKPVSHELVPDLQALAGWHVCPSWQKMHCPERHTRFCPQLVPSASTRPSSAHCAVPVSQLSRPPWQGFCGTQLPPPTHSTQLPSTQAPPEHGVPLARFSASTHTETPVSQDVTPALHSLSSVHGLFSAHALQAPLLHTLSGPQELPLGKALPVSSHPSSGEHSTKPVWQGLAGTQSTPS